MDTELTLLCEIIDRGLGRDEKVDVKCILDLLARLLPYESAVFASFNIDHELIKSVQEVICKGEEEGWLNFFRKNNRLHNEPVVVQALAEKQAYEWCDSIRRGGCRAHLPSGMRCHAGHVKGIAYAYPTGRTKGRFSFLSLQGIRVANISLYRRVLENIVPHIHDALSGEPAANEPPDKLGLSSRELEVLKWVGRGKRSKEIGHILAISENTVKYHLSNVFLKLDVTNRTQAISKAINHNLLGD